MEMWSGERNYGPGSSAGGGKCGPGREIMVLGQTPPRPSVVRGEKLWSWVKRWWREVWSRERNRGSGSSAAPPECGPRREIMVLGQVLVAGSVVQGEKLRPRVKRCPARVWSREQNCGPGHPRPRPSVVQGEKPCPRVNPVPAEAWSREQNGAPGSSQAPPECGPGSKTAASGQARPRRSMVQGAKPCPRVTPCPARVWSREQNRAPGSPPAPPKCGLGSKTVPPGHPVPARAWSSHLKYKKESKTNI